MIYFINIILAITILVLVGILLSSHHYNDMLMGTIVGKYKKDKLNGYGGFITVEIITEKLSDSGFKYRVTVTETYEVPDMYYTSVKIGDTGLFPY